MRKRTSDFMALAAIFGGAGIGLGLTSLVAGRAPDTRLDEASIKNRVVEVKSSVVTGVNPVTVIVTGKQEYPELQVRTQILRVEAARDQVERLRADLEELRGRELLQARSLYEQALESLEGLEDLEDLELVLDLDRTLTIDVLERDEYEDERRRRRRRRPREAAPAPPGN